MPLELPKQALEQTRDSVLRHGEAVGCELLNLFFLRPRMATSCGRRPTGEAGRSAGGASPGRFRACRRDNNSSTVNGTADDFVRGYVAGFFALPL